MRSHRRRRTLLALAAACGLAAPAAAAASPTRPTYVALGDSTGAGVGAGGVGYPARLARALGAAGLPVRLVNLSVSGATSADVVRAQLPRVAAAAPSLVTVSIGVNDLVRQRPLAAYARDLGAVADALARTGAAVVFTTLPDLSLTPSARRGDVRALRQRIAGFNAVVRGIAGRHGFAVVDVCAASERAVRTDGDRLFAADGFHPSAAGYQRWAEAMLPAAERALAPPRRARRPASADARRAAR